MKKMLFIIFYESKDYLSSIDESFKKLYIDVITYPLFKYAYDVQSKIENYQDHLSQFIIDNKPDIVLWWFIDVPLDVFKYVVTNNPHIYYILYNSDDPHNLNSDFFEKCKFFNLILTPCNESIYLYKLFSKKESVLFLPFGYDPEYIFKIPKELHDDNEYQKYSADISIFTYEIFLASHHKNQYINMIDMINDIINYAKRENKIVKIYGIYSLNEFFPDHYCGDLPYVKINLVYNFSKINITTHADCKISLAINKYLFSILGAGGLVLVDKLKDIDKILTHRKNCIVMDKEKYIDQIDDILKNYETYEHIKDNALEIANQYTWRKWVDKIMYHYSITYFDEDFYSNLYGLDKNTNLLQYWKDYGSKNMDICYKFIVPNNFDCKAYERDTLSQNKSREFLYLDWHKNSKHNKYLMDINKKIKQKTVDIEKLNLTMDQYYNICTVLNNIRNNIDRDKNLLLLGNITDKIYDIKINDVINSYLSSL